MKDLIAIVAVATAVLVIAIMVVLSCGKPVPPGPGPDPLTEYSVVGPVSKIEGKLKPGAKATVEEAKRYMQTAVDIID